MKRLCRGQSGGVAMLLVVGFMLFGVAVVTSNLRLSTVLSTDSQVKNDILNRQYCALGVIEYVRYLTLDAQAGPIGGPPTQTARIRPSLAAMALRGESTSF